MCIIIYKEKYQWAQTKRLALFGPVFVVAIFHLPVPCLFRIRVEAIKLLKHWLVSKYTNKIYKNVPMVPKTQDASFGPVNAVAIFYLPVLCVFRRVETIKHWLVSKYTKKKYKNVPTGSTTQDASFGPFSSTPPSISIFVACFVEYNLYLQ